MYLINLIDNIWIISKYKNIEESEEISAIKKDDVFYSYNKAKEYINKCNEVGYTDKYKNIEELNYKINKEKLLNNILRGNYDFIKPSYRIDIKNKLLDEYISDDVERELRLPMGDL